MNLFTTTWRYNDDCTACIVRYQETVTCRLLGVPGTVLGTWYLYTLLIPNRTCTATLYQYARTEPKVCFRDDCIWTETEEAKMINKCLEEVIINNNISTLIRSNKEILYDAINSEEFDKNELDGSSG